MKQTLLYMLVVGFAINVHGQSLDTNRLSWTVTGFVNNSNGEYVSYACRFESESGKVKWIQKEGSVIYEFSITGRQGAWEDVSKDGQVTYLVTFRSNSGTIQFTRSGNTLSIETNVPIDGKNSLPYRFSVSSINTL